MNSILLLAFEYFKIGCIAIGGGYTVIPFLYYLVDKYEWFDVFQITQMIAVSNLTPGPIGINMATYVGLKVGGLTSAILTTFAFMLPSFVFVCMMAKFIKQNKDNKCMQSVMQALKPAALAMITVALIKILNSTVINLDITNLNKSKTLTELFSIQDLLLLIGFLCVGFKLKKQPMILILVAILVGIVFHFYKFIIQ